MTGSSQLLAAATDTGTGEAVTFWLLAPLAVLGALGVLFSKKAVHSALLLALTMLSLAVLYLAAGRAVPRCRPGGRLHRRGDDAVPVRADARRRRLG